MLGKIKLSFVSFVFIGSSNYVLKGIVDGLRGCGVNHEHRVDGYRVRF